MNPLNLFSTSTKSRSASVSAQARKNCYLEQNDDVGGVVAYGFPGSSLFLNLGTSPIRGMYSLGDWLYIVYESSVYRIGENGSYTIYPLVLSTSAGIVDICDNGIQILIVDGVSGYIITLSTNALAEITDVEFPVCNTCACLNGVFVVNEIDSGRFFISSSYDGFNWDALDFATAESNSDNLIRVLRNGGNLYLMGDLSIETWGYTGDLDFPFSCFTDSTLEWGIDAIWSVAKFDNTFTWLAKNRRGGVHVFQFNGGSPTKISTFDIDNIFNSYSITNDAIAISYIINGHPIYQISFPTEQTTWIYDGASGFWSQLNSYGDTRINYNLCNIAFGNIYLSDYRNGNIYILNESLYTENGLPIEMEIVSKHMSNGLERVTINKLQIDIETGVGESVGVISPKIMLQISRDDGHTWGNESFLDAGKIGEYNARAVRYRLGQARSFTFRLKFTDAVKKIIKGIWVSL